MQPVNTAGGLPGAFSLWDGNPRKPMKCIDIGKSPS